MNKTPKISIIIPVRNGEAFIRKAIESILQQDYSNSEILIFDGLSQDKTMSIIATFTSFIHYFESQADHGQSHAINKGFAKCQGDIVTWLNADDAFTPNALQSVAYAYQQNPHAVAWCGKTLLKNVQNSSIEFPVRYSGSHISEYLKLVEMHGMPNPQPSTFFNRNLLGSQLHVNEHLHLAMDFDLCLRVFALGEVVAIPEVWTEMLLHDQAKTCQNPYKSLLEIYQILKEHSHTKTAYRFKNLVLQKNPYIKRFWQILYRYGFL